MAISLTTSTFPAQITYTGSQEFELAEHKKLTVDSTGVSGKLLEKTVPAGKRWAVRVTVFVNEYDA